MSDLNQDEQRCRQAADQAWAGLRAVAPDLLRIADRGPTPADAALVRQAANVVVAELAVRALPPLPGSLADALAGLIEGVERDSREKGISGFTAARLTDARAALADHGR
jgi:hypothetical protein